MQLDFKYSIEHRKVKHSRIKVTSEQFVKIIVPHYFNDDDIEHLLNIKKEWIVNSLKKLSSFQKISLNRNHILYRGDLYSYFYDGELKNKIIVNQVHKTIQSSKNLLDEIEQKKWYKKEAKKYLTQRTQALAERFNYKYEKIFVRSQKTKWGSCSTKGNLSFNYKLIKAPLYVIDYIVIHELIHTQTMDHSKKFWNILRSHYPEYEKSVIWLNTYGKNL